MDNELNIKALDKSGGETSDFSPLKGTHSDRALASPVDTAAPSPASRVRQALPAAPETGAELAPQRGRGRPKGSRNLRSEAVAVGLVERYGDPLEADVAIGTMPIGELITLLRCLASDRGLKLGMTVGDVLKLQAECRRSALPYIHAKRAPEDAKGNPVVPIIGLGIVATPSMAGGGVSIEDAIDVEQYQEVSEVDAEKSETEKSDE